MDYTRYRRRLRTTSLGLGTAGVSAVAFAGLLGGAGQGSVQAQSGDETHTGTFQPVNAANLDSQPSGTATFTVSGDDVRIEVNAAGLAPGIAHAVHLHLAESCPSPTADTNNDGYVDVMEAVKAAPILLPLDDDLSNQDEDVYEESDDDGTLTYTQVVSMDELMDAVSGDSAGAGSTATSGTSTSTAGTATAGSTMTPSTGGDGSFEDALETLPAGEEIDWSGVIVSIHGVEEDADLPDTVASMDGKEAHETLPVACATLTQSGTGTPGAGATGTSTTGGSTAASPTSSAGSTMTPSAGATGTATSGAVGGATTTSTPAATTTATPSTGGTGSTSTPSTGGAATTGTPAGTSTVAGIQAPASGNTITRAADGGLNPLMIAGLAAVAGAALLFGVSQRARD